MDNKKEMNKCGKVEAETLVQAGGNNIVSMGENGPLIAKIPVVLAEKDIQIDVEAMIELKEPFFEIKRIKKNVFLTQCKLVPTVGGRDCNGRMVSGKLFLEGFVEKNFEYATVDCTKHGVVSGDIKHTTVKVPFRCVTEVFYERQPIITYRANPKELDLFHHREHKDCGPELLGKNPCETGFEEFITYVEKPFCELEAARIFEADILMCKEPLKDKWDWEDKDECEDHDFFEDKECHKGKKREEVEVFKKVLEKMVVFLRIKVLQLQQVRIP